METLTCLFIVLTDYPEEPQHENWEHPPCCCQHSEQHSEQHHSPHTETEADRTEADEGDLLENVPAEDVAGGAEEEEEEAEDVTTDAVRESDSPAGSEEDAGLQSDLGANEREELHQHKEPGGQIDLGVPEKELAGVLKELELTLQMTTMMEQEKVEDLARPVETEPAQSQVRRRNKRRSAKKAAHWLEHDAHELEPGAGVCEEKLFFIIYLLSWDGR